MHDEVWLPLRGLGLDAPRVERALAADPPADVVRLLASLPSGDARSAASRAAADFALHERTAERPDLIEPAGRRAATLLRAAGETRAATLVEVELLASLGSSRARLTEILAESAALTFDPSDSLLMAATLRLRGGLLRSQGDLRGSLAALERARALADESSSVREILRSRNTLGASYAALGITALAREALESARELADVTGQRQSAAIAAGQLATLSLDAGDPTRAARHLRVQRAVSEHLGDVRGLARALSLLVEAHAEAGDPAGARSAAEASRALHSRAPTHWTHLQALLATIYEAEGAFAAGDDVRGSELTASCSADLASSDPGLRVARARSCFGALWSSAQADAPPPDVACGRALSLLSLSPRPTWVERALLLSVDVAARRLANELVPRLAIRAAVVLEARAAASSRSLIALRRLAPEEAIARAMALGRDLLLISRLALSPLIPFHAHRLDLRAIPVPGALDAILGRLETILGPDDHLLALDGPDGARLVTTRPDLADAAESALTGDPAVLSATRGEGETRLVEDATMGLSLRDA